jgi:uncharacterized membrane protein
MDSCTEKDRKRSQQLSLCPPKSEKWSRTTHRDRSSLDLFLARNAEKLGIKVYDFVRLHWLGIVNFHLFFFILGSVSAPCLSYWGQEGIAKYIYGFYGFSCHQIPSRSFFIFGQQIAICARCFSFFSSMLIFGLLLSLLKIRPLDRRIAFLLACPLLVDVSLQTLGIEESTNLLRVTTAILLSLSISFYIYPRIKVCMERFTKDPKTDFMS